jgi:hypothetical protein
MKLDPIKLHQAIRTISPNSQFSCEGDCYEGLTWYNDEYQPTEEEIVQKIAELEYQEEVNEYQRQRAREYPSYAAQFDQIFHEGVDAWKATVQAVKDKYPKQVMEPEVLEERKRLALADLEASRES